MAKKSLVFILKSDSRSLWPLTFDLYKRKSSDKSTGAKNKQHKGTVPVPLKYWQIHCPMSPELIWKQLMAVSWFDTCTHTRVMVFRLSWANMLWSSGTTANTHFSLTAALISITQKVCSQVRYEDNLVTVGMTVGWCDAVRGTRGRLWT